MNSSIITTFQRCNRRQAIESQWSIEKHDPKRLFNAILVESIYKLSNGGDLKEVIQESATIYLSCATSPGLDLVGTDPYRVACEYVAMMTNILEAVSRLTLLKLWPMEQVKLPHSVDWNFQSFQDEGGMLHRWITVDSWDENRMYQEMHSWHVAGDTAIAKVPMWLHVIEIGRIIKGRRASPWTRAFRHPMIRTKYRFQKRRGEALEGDWKPIYFQDNTDNKSKVWVDIMQEDGVLEDLIYHIDVKDPNETIAGRVIADIVTLSEDVERQTMWADDSSLGPFSIPMNRASCDFPSRCPHQDACFAEKFDFKSSGIYVRAKKLQTV